MNHNSRYRLLEVGERVEDGDEEYAADELMDLPAAWRPVAVEFIGEAVQETTDPPVRRAINNDKALDIPCFMELGRALEIVLAMARSLYRSHGEFCEPAECPADVTSAMDTVEDFIVNHFGEDEHAVCTECGRPYFVTPEGTAHHVGDGPDGIDHDADAGHVPYGDEPGEDSLSALFEAMERHGNAEGTETQLGDAEEFLRLAFGRMSTEEQAAFLASQEIREFIRNNGEDSE
jgi:hypothetical protein